MAERRLTPERLDDDGAAVGKDGDLLVHVRGALPGESVRAAIEHQSPHRREAWARLVALDGPPSPDRVAPPCADAGFGRCGGCALQHLSAPAQRAFKAARVAAALPGVPVAPLVPAPAATGWRNRAKYVVGRTRGGLVLGSYAPASHDLVDMAGCAVPEPAIAALVGPVTAALAPTALPVYDETTRSGELRFVLLRANHAGRVQLLVITRTAAARPALATMAERLLAEHGGSLAGVAHQVQGGPGGAILGDDEAVLAGAAGLEERVGPVTLWLGASAFFQVHRAQAEKLYAAAAEAALADLPDPAAARVIDLYCGAGGIGLTAAARGARVVGVESLAAAVRDATRSAELSGLAERAAFLAGDASDGLPAAGQLLGGAVDAVIVDPPRKGLSAAARAALLAAAAPRIVYVSCEPATLGRDIAALATGYRATAGAPFDLMPGTPDVETVVTLERLTR